MGYGFALALALWIHVQNMCACGGGLYLLFLFCLPFLGRYHLRRCFYAFLFEIVSRLILRTRCRAVTCNEVMGLGSTDLHRSDSCVVCGGHEAVACPGFHDRTPLCHFFSFFLISVVVAWSFGSFLSGLFFLIGSMARLDVVFMFFGAFLSIFVSIYIMSEEEEEIAPSLVPIQSRWKIGRWEIWKIVFDLFLRALFFLCAITPDIDRRSPLMANTKCLPACWSAGTFPIHIHIHAPYLLAPVLVGWGVVNERTERSCFGWQIRSCTAHQNPDFLHLTNETDLVVDGFIWVSYIPCIVVFYLVLYLSINVPSRPLPTLSLCVCVRQGCYLLSIYLSSVKTHLPPYSHLFTHFFFFNKRLLLSTCRAAVSVSVFCSVVFYCLRNPPVRPPVVSSFLLFLLFSFHFSLYTLIISQGISFRAFRHGRCTIPRCASYIFSSFILGN